MFSTPVILSAVGFYLALLVWVGYRADGPLAAARARQLQPIVYGLSLATLCSAWTYFGAVGDASKGSWLYVANAMGPIIAVTIGYPVWQRIAILSKQENVGSIADFLAARYGKSRPLGVVVACVAALGALPYISLQLAVLTRVWAISANNLAPPGRDAFVLIALLAVMAIIFGARRPSLTQQNRGFVSIIALESCVKLAGLLAVATIGLWFFARTPGGWAMAARAFPPLPTPWDLSFVTLVLLCTVTAFTLPRQFHLGFVSLERVQDIRGAAWVLPLYFTLWVVATLIISLTIRAGLGTPGGDPYLQVLAVPMRQGGHFAALLALLGGLSAGSAMVIVETTAVSAIVSNEIVLPLLSRVMHRRSSEGRLDRSILRVRRVTIVAIALCAWLYYLGIRGLQAPTQLGLTALTAFAQLLPGLVGALYWRRGHANGVISGIVAGMLVWGVTIAGPSFLAYAGAPTVKGDVLWGPLPNLSPTLAIYASLAINVVLYVAVSLRSAPKLIDRIQAERFVADPRESSPMPGENMRVTVGDLRRLLTQFLGSAEAERGILDISIVSRVGPLTDDREVGPNLVRAAERLLAGVIGAPSARNVVAIALSAGSQNAREISRILDEAAHAVHFSRELLRTTLDSLPQGISVVDQDQRLIAWNTKFLELMALPLSEVYVGKALSETLSAPMPAAANGTVRRHLVARMDALTRHDALEEEIDSAGGRRLRLTSRSLVDGDYLIILDDITDIRMAASVLARSNEELEQLVDERTHELRRANDALSIANQVAEQATGAQRRFVAAASHDLVQPLHAARLFIGNVLVGLDQDTAMGSLLRRADQAVETAHRLLHALLYLSQLEIGAIKPNLRPVDAGALLASLFQEFAPQAETRGLEFVLIPTDVWVHSDVDLLRSMLQNLILNALRYTAIGRVVIAVRRSRAGFRFEVRDTGIGIAPEKLETAFGEYSRLSEGRSMSEGAGLGLSIVARIAQVLGHAIAVRSQPGRGSVFSITAPAAAALPRAIRSPDIPVTLNGLTVLCVDDEHEVLFATAALLERWGAKVTPFASAEAALQQSGPWDVVLADYQLGGKNGLELLRELKDKAGMRMLVMTAPEASWASSLASEGIVLMSKPLAPLVLRTILADAPQRRRA